jgi:hypothetical protein
MDQALLERCRSLYNRARLGEAKARHEIQVLKARAKAGDRGAAMVFNTMAVLHWQSQEPGPHRPRWPRAEAFYKRLAQNDMEAWRIMTRIQAGARARDEQSMRVFAMLKAIHHQYKVSVWYPGAPRMAGYGLPNRDRAGIEIPGMSSILPLTPQVGARLLDMIAWARQAAVQRLPPQGSLEMMDAGPAPPSAAPGKDAAGDLLAAMAQESAPALAAPPVHAKTVSLTALQAAVARRRALPPRRTLSSAPKI